MKRVYNTLANSLRYGFIATLATLAPLSLNAQDRDIFKFGILASYQTSTGGDLKKFTTDNSSPVGFSGGIFVEVGFTQRFAFRPRFEYGVFRAKSASSSSSDKSSIANTMSAAGDLMLRFNNGLYLFGGADYLMPSLKDDFIGLDGQNIQSGLGATAGLGYYHPKLRGVGIEARYTKSFGLKLGDEDFEDEWIQISLNFRGDSLLKFLKWWFTDKK
jgi:hypothetical protein